MKILHCVEFYHPSPGGSQALVRHVSEELVRRGHDVTVASTRLRGRTDRTLNGVSIKEFSVAGNAVQGLRGGVKDYQRFVINGGFDQVMTYSAQQWTTDALLPILDRIPSRLALAPCGFSRLHDPSYAGYYERLPRILREFNSLIFHSSTYQDIEFARRAGLENLNVVPNGASRAEFEGTESDFREQHGIDRDEPLLLTVGPHNWMKGHALTIEGFRQAEIDGTLVVIGNRPLRRGCQWNCRRRALMTRIGSGGRKRVKVLDVPRDEVLAAYKAADLFVFGSQIEASPLVLFEAAASGTPFISTAVGNAEEIAEWTGGGVIVPSVREGGRVSARPEAFAAEMTRLWNDAEGRSRLAESGRARWLGEFTWDRIAESYEAIYERAAPGV